jgi:hypothetical protein
MNEKIFIAYSREDREYASHLASELVKRGLSPWIDDQIVVGADWLQNLEENITSSSAIIVIMTEDSRESEWVRRELGFAMQLNKPIFPILLEGTTPWIELIDTQYVDATGGQLPPDIFFERLANVSYGRTISPRIPPKEEILPPDPFQGSSGFIFSSYKKEEMDVVAPYLNSMVSWGFHVWYDKGIPGGADWLDMIGSRVSDCEIMVVFLSPAAVDSKWVRSEVFLAIQEEKPIVAVKLEEVELKRGLQLALVSIQHLESWSDKFEEDLKTAIHYHFSQ